MNVFYVKTINFLEYNYKTYFLGYIPYMIYLNFIFVMFFGFQALAHVCEDQPTDLSLVLAIDLSSSMDNDEIKTQIEGYRNSINHPAVINNLLYCRCTSIGVVLWSDSSQVGFPLTRMESQENIDQLSDFFQSLLNQKDLALTRNLGYQTELVSALEFSKKTILAEITKSNEKIINISGDGYDSRMPSSNERLKLLKQEIQNLGITVNGVPVDIYRTESDFIEAENSNSFEATNNYTSPYSSVSDYYKKEVITPNGYVERAESFKDLERALTTTLIRDTCKLMM